MIPYRIRRVLQRLSIILLIMILTAALVLLCWMLWLNRYVIYTKDGAKLDFDLSLTYPQGELAVPPETTPSVPIHYNNGSNLPIAGELQKLDGYYVELSALAENPAAIQEAIVELPKGTPILLDMKSIRGDFYYSSSLGKTATDIDLAQISGLLSQLKQDYYLIARIPAFRDYWYGLENVPDGLPKIGGNGALWMDEDRCYWLNPTSEGTLTYLIRIVTELKNLGFREVVFSDFRFPDTDAIDFSGDQSEALNQAAVTLAKACASDSFAVSFIRNAPDLTLPQGQCRLYLDGVDAADAQTMAEQANLQNVATRIVFLTTLNDTRFDAYGVLRPIDLAH